MNQPGPATDGSDLIGRMRRHRQNGLAEMAAGMAHEISQPLGGIRGFAEGILIGIEEGWDITGEEIKAKMRRIIEEADRIDDLIQGVRAFADEEGRSEVVAVNAGSVVRAALRLGGTRMQAHGVSCSCHETGVPAMVRGSPFALQEVVQHLLGNAADACEQRHRGDGGNVVITVDGGSGRDEPVSITVADDGCGMDAGTLARAGEPFFTTKGPDRGVGLGLAMARGILGQCGGQLSLASTAGVGTTAVVRLWHRAGGGDNA